MCSIDTSQSSAVKIHHQFQIEGRSIILIRALVLVLIMHAMVFFAGGDSNTRNLFSRCLTTVHNIIVLRQIITLCNNFVGPYSLNFEVNSDFCIEKQLGV